MEKAGKAAKVVKANVRKGEGKVAAPQVPSVPSDNPTIVLALPISHVNVIAEALAAQPYNRVAALLSEIQRQATKQLLKQQPQPPQPQPAP